MRIFLRHGDDLDGALFGAGAAIGALFGSDGGEEISAGEIVRAVEESLDATHCYGTGQCRGGAECLAHGLWSDMNRLMTDFLDGQSLAAIKTRYANTHRSPGDEAVVIFKNKRA